MKLKSFSIENFRLITRLNEDLGSRLTLFIGENGAGKTSVLDAISIGLGAALTHLPNVSGISFKKTGDIRSIEGREEPFARIRLDTVDNVVWDRTTRRDKSATTTKLISESVGLKSLEQYLDRTVIDRHNHQEDFTLPPLVFYGVSRALLDIPLRRKGFPKSHSRFDALAGALNSESRFKSAFIWFYNKENEEHRLQKEQRSFDVFLPELQAVRRAIELMFPDLSEPHIELNPLRFVVKKDGQFLNIDQLSDGYKTLLGLVIDLSSRMAMANPKVSDPLAVESVVMIDEVDLHLHPAWQQRVVMDLLRTFPNTQFILTTHSPFVVEAVNNLLKRNQVKNLIPNLEASDDVQNLYPLEANDTKAYLVKNGHAESLLDSDVGLLDDRLLHYMNSINFLYDQMRDIEWEHKQRG